MDERTARDVVLVRAIETADEQHAFWSDADRIGASRTAAETVGDSAPVDAFIGRRARFALDRLATRQPVAARIWRQRDSRGWIAAVLIGLAFIVGGAGVDIGPSQRINLLAPPVLALLAWNLVVYVFLVVATLGLAMRPGGTPSHPLRRMMARALGDAPRASRTQAASGALTAALGRFAREWSMLAAPLWRQRAACVLHAAAASLAAGAIAGLYLRGIAFEYRAVWQSTFLESADVARVLHLVLAPGARLTGIALPGADAIARLSASGPGEIAAPWIHLYAGTLVACVIAPRLVLAAMAWIRGRMLASRFPLRLEGPYFQQLLHAWHAGTLRVLALPYSFTVPAVAMAGLTAVLARVFQSQVDVQWMPAVRYGDDPPAALPAMPPTAVLAVFNLSATPERDNHGAFAAALRDRTAGRIPFIAVVDSSEFAERFRDHPTRIDERAAAWQVSLAADGIEALIVRLAQPDVASAAASFRRRLERLPA